MQLNVISEKSSYLLLSTNAALSILLVLVFFCGKLITDQYSMCYFVRRWVIGWITNRRSFSSADTIPHPFLLLCINSAWHLRSETMKSLTVRIRLMVRSLSASQVSSIHKNSGLGLLLSWIQVRSFSPNWVWGWTRREEEKTVKYNTRPLYHYYHSKVLYAGTEGLKLNVKYYLAPGTWSIVAYREKEPDNFALLVKTAVSSFRSSDKWTTICQTKSYQILLTNPYQKEVLVTIVSKSNFLILFRCWKDWFLHL